MQVGGVFLSFSDVPRSADADYVRWLDLEYLPELAALRGVISARRYVASERDLAVRGSGKLGAGGATAGDRHPLDGGRGRFCTVCLLGDDPPAAARRIEARTKELARFAAQTTAFSHAYRLLRSFAAKRIAVSADALAHLGHRGIQLGFGAVKQKKDLAEAIQWWSEFHHPDMLGVPGWMAALMFEPLGEEGEGRLMHLYLLDAPPAQAHAELEKVRYKWREAGRSPAPRGIYERSFSGPWSAVRPLEGART